MPSVANCSWDIDMIPQTKSKYQSLYLTLCCRLELPKLTKALMSVKGLANTFDVSTK
jgi:hypothetical protein